MARQARVVTRRRTTCRLHRIGRTSTLRSEVNHPPILPNPTRPGPAPGPPTKQAGATARARQPSAAMVDYSKFNNLDISDDDEANEKEQQQQPKMITPLFHVSIAGKMCARRIARLRAVRRSRQASSCQIAAVTLTVTPRSHAQRPQTEGRAAERAGRNICRKTFFRTIPSDL